MLIPAISIIFWYFAIMKAPDHQNVSTFRIHITGLVQGVGFRPFVHRLAVSQGISGWVENRNDGVNILINETQEGAEKFKQAIKELAPAAADIESLSMSASSPEVLEGFTIKSSEDVSGIITEIGPDIAVCTDCLADMKQQPHRINYPFINCTHCGPRFTIIRDLPYDRPHTTMDAFTMCPECRSEYENVHDRRFHAQPVACTHCGPVYVLENEKGTNSQVEEILDELALGISQGKIYALKGMGGFHLLCNALNENAIARLRKIKERDGKPFALMCRSSEAARSFVEVSKEEQELLETWQRPIVLLKRSGPITPGIADGLNSLGIMLPYMPLHHLLFEHLDTPAIVLTSGNLSDEPIVIHNKRATELFGKKLAGIVSYNREIFNRCDDSVAMLTEGQSMILRRSRGFAPSPLRTRIQTEGIFAAGAELVNSFAIGKGSQVIMSQYIGDLKNLETFEFYREIYQRYSRMFRFSPDLVVHDLHPDYLSTRFARQLAQEHGNIPVVPVQHHHAHLASVMLEHDLKDEVIGFSFDGLGLGDDGKLWGAEAMVAGYREYKRVFHFDYLPMPGGDKASQEPWRMAISYLYTYLGEGFREEPLPLFDAIETGEVENIIHMMDRSLNTPMISSAGRLFDAMASLLGITHRASYQAEAPMKLEALADMSEQGVYPFEIRDGRISFGPMIIQVVKDLEEGLALARIAGKFHQTLAQVVLEMALWMRKEYEINRVVISGGVFQNRILTGRLWELLSAERFKVFLPKRIPVNDQGIAAGQLAIGAARSDRI